MIAVAAVDGGIAKPVELDEVEAAVDLPPVNVEVAAGLLIHSVGSPLEFCSPARAYIRAAAALLLALPPAVVDAPLPAVVVLPLSTRSITTFSRGMMHLGFLSPGLLK